MNRIYNDNFAKNNSEINECQFNLLCEGEKFVLGKLNQNKLKIF